MLGRSESCARTEKFWWRWIHQNPVFEGLLIRFLQLPLLLLSLATPALAQMKFVLQYQVQFGFWKRWGEKHNKGDAYGTAKARAKATCKRFRIFDDNCNGDNCNLIYLVTP